jgi:hypothetical protein
MAHREREKKRRKNQEIGLDLHEEIQRTQNLEGAETVPLAGSFDRSPTAHTTTSQAAESCRATPSRREDQGNAGSTATGPDILLPAAIVSMPGETTTALRFKIGRGREGVSVVT